MDTDEPLQRLQDLQRDLLAFAESRHANLDRLSAELDASVGDLKRLLEKKDKSEASRNKLAPTNGTKPETLNIDDVEYSINEDFRQAALLVSDELNIDELDAAKLCIQSAPEDSVHPDTALPFRAILRFHNHRQTLLHCLQLLLQQAYDADDEDEITRNLRIFTNGIIQDNADSSAYWRKCIAGLSDIEIAIKKVGDHKQTMVMTGQDLTNEMGEALEAQNMLLTREHECLSAVMSYLIRGNHVKPQDFRQFISKAAELDAAPCIAAHYLPVFMSGSAYFGSDTVTTAEAAHDLHTLFAQGPGQKQYKQPSLKAAATVCWLAEYSSRFQDTLTDPNLRVADRQKAEEERTKLFLDCVGDKALHYLLAVCAFFKPIVWLDPAKEAFLNFLLPDSQRIGKDAPPVSPDFASLTMGELRGVADSFIANMPDALRRLKQDEDYFRERNYRRDFSEAQPMEPELERFLIILSYAYDDDAEAAMDFWSDREGNLFGFLRWTAERLPTPRVATFCELLRSVAKDAKSANHAHKFLLEETGVRSGRMRKMHSVSWSQIFNEFDFYATSFKDKVSVPQSSTHQTTPPMDMIETETSIMLEAYLRLTAHMCRTSPEARNWILREQTFPLGDIVFQLASSAIDPRLQACCFDLLAAMLADDATEVNDGMWVMLDSWISGGSAAGSNSGRPQASVKPMAEKYYLQRFNDNPETSAAFVGLLNSLLVVSPDQVEATLDALPFPENLGSPNRHPGIDVYVDFVMGTAFRLSAIHSHSYSEAYINVLRCKCLDFAFICLSTFNENLVMLANTTTISVDSAIRASSLANYARLHPFARVMEWLFNNNVIEILSLTVNQNVDDLNELDPESPIVHSVLKGVEVLNLAMNLQSTYFDIVRPIVKTHSAPRIQPVANAAFASFDDVLLSQLTSVQHIVSFTSNKHLGLSLESLDLVQKLSRSKRLNDNGQSGVTRNRTSNRLIGLLSDTCEGVALGLRPDFQLYEYDLENGEAPAKLMRAQAVLDLLVGCLEASVHRPTLAHCFLGFTCREQNVFVAPDSRFAFGYSLFHTIASCAAQAPISIAPSNISWLLSVKRGCLDVLMKLAISPLTASIVQSELRSMDFLAALSQNQIPTSENQLWDMKTCSDPEVLLTTSAQAIRDFLRCRELYFEYAAIELRTATEDGAFSIQEKSLNTLRGSIQYPNGEREPTLSVFDLFDFFDLETTDSSDVACKFLNNIDLSGCMKDNAEILEVYDTKVAEQLLILKKRELLVSGIIKEPTEEQQIDDEITAILASLTSQNTWRLIQNARVSALESWSDLMSQIVTAGGLESQELTAFTLRGLQIVLPKFERCLSESFDSAAFLAKLTLTFVPVVLPTSQGSTQEGVMAASERLLLAFRVCLKAITDGGSGLALRDVCYRTCCSILGSMPLTSENGRRTASPNAKQLLQLVQVTGERLLSVITEDAFSGRGSTRVSAVLFLDSLIILFKSTNMIPAIMKALAKLNFAPVLIDSSIGSVATSFQAPSDELATTLAYFHTALALLLRICQTSDGTQLILNSGFFDAVADSRLFSTDPDIGLEVDNAAALKEFYRLLSSVLRVITAIVITRGSSNVATLQQAQSFLQNNRFSIQAVFKRTSAVQKTAGPPEVEALEVADELSRLMLVTGFLEQDEPAYLRTSKTNGFT
ncbi:Hypothetical protein R9X50_00482000 [Acrodontium crateriforme]|uniref:Uncharacterized protein n=1 Tax=Acrodontium crateriforme TaxID=150365 RepID=A0AAQ3RAF1_9PEZI|nr:Hypothetical protein R9X50_00482000 [Acrodontium crateriforme]